MTIINKDMFHNVEKLTTFENELKSDTLNGYFQKNNKDFVYAWRIEEAHEYIIKESNGVISPRRMYIEPIIIEVDNFKIELDQKKLGLTDDEFEKYKWNKSLEDMGAQTFGYIPCSQQIFIICLQDQIVQLYKGFDDDILKIHKELLSEVLNLKLNNDNQIKNRIKI